MYIYKVCVDDLSLHLMISYISTAWLKKIINIMIASNYHFMQYLCLLLFMRTVSRLWLENYITVTDGIYRGQMVVIIGDQRLIDDKGIVLSMSVGRYSLS